jgi:hypothetical protein
MVMISEPFELGIYFPTKKESDDYTMKYLKDKFNFLEKDIEIL